MRFLDKKRKYVLILSLRVDIMSQLLRLSRTHFWFITGSAVLPKVDATLFTTGYSGVPIVVRQYTRVSTVAFSSSSK